MILSDELVAKYDDLRAIHRQMALMADRARQLRIELINALGGDETGATADGRVLLTYRPTRRFDTGKALRFLTAAQAVTASTYDERMMRGMLTDEQVAQCVTDGPRKLVDHQPSVCDLRVRA